MIERIRVSLFNKNGREILIFVFFVFLSFSFWLLQTLNDTYETELFVPLRLKEVPENVVITEELPSKLLISVSDKGTVLMNYLLTHSFYPIAIDFNDYAEGDESVWFPSASLARKVASQLNQSTKINSILPDSIGYVYTRGVAQKKPIKVQGEFLLDRQYYISSIQCEPDSILIYAPKAILDTLQVVYTQPIRRDNISESVAIETAFVPIKGVRFTESTCNVSLNVDIYAEKSVEVPVVGLNFPEDKVLRTFPSKVQVTFQVGLKHFQAVSDTDFFIGVEYEELLNSTTGKCRVRLKDVPHFVNHPRIAPIEIDFLIEPRIYQND
ncbi:MAG: CdaR family protein [Phocaeicola sp.]